MRAAIIAIKFSRGRSLEESPLLGSKKRMRNEWAADDRKNDSNEQNLIPIANN